MTPLHHHSCFTFNLNMKSINWSTHLIPSDLKLMSETLWVSATIFSQKVKILVLLVLQVEETGSTISTLEMLCTFL